MNLKKSDKLIAVAAVLVLVIAAIGIIFYTETEDSEEEIESDIQTYCGYEVVYDVKESSATPDNTDYIVKDKLLGADVMYNGTVDITGRHVKQITFKIDYKDRHAGLLLKSAGADTLTISVCGTNMAEQTGMIKGQGNVTFTSSQKSALSLDQIEAKDDFEAREKLDENLSEEQMDYTYTITASLKQGEKFIFKPIKWLLEKIGSDSFQVEITYEYYDYDVELVETEDMGEDNSESDDDNKETSINLIRSTSGRDWF